MNRKLVRKYRFYFRCYRKISKRAIKRKNRNRGQCNQLYFQRYASFR